MITFNPDQCCGCTACMNICPKDAISMEEDDNGFILPIINLDKCINCGLCENVCDFKHEKRNDSNVIKSYSLVAKEKSVLKKSTSGGAFTCLSNVILNNNGYACGAIMDKEFNIRHIIVNSVEGRDSMRGSKYVQSNVGLTFRSIKKLIKENKQVLFVGTPCQCAGLQSYIGRDDDNLFVVDFLCHGVPNNRMFKDHISYLNSFYGIPSVGYSFRNKTYGWDSYNNNNNYTADGKVRIKWINQAYYNFFISNQSLRPSCFNCPYRSMHRPSDITIADFWQIEKFTGKRDYKGVSLVLGNSTKGLQLIEESRKQANLNEYKVNDISFRIQTTPPRKPKSYEKFWDTYKQLGYEKLVIAFFNNSLKKRIRFEIRKFIKYLHNITW